MSLREDASPLSVNGSPTATTVTAADFAALTAASKPLVSVHAVSQPGAVVTVALGAAALMPCSTVTTLPFVTSYPIGWSGPSWSAASSASGPTTAIEGVPVLSGSALLWFSSRTIDLSALV